MSLFFRTCAVPSFVKRAAAVSTTTTATFIPTISVASSLPQLFTPSRHNSSSSSDLEHEQKKKTHEQQEVARDRAARIGRRSAPIYGKGGIPRRREQDAESNNTSSSVSEKSRGADKSKNTPDDQQHDDGDADLYRSHPQLDPKESPFGMRRKSIEHDRARAEGKEPDVVKVENMYTYDRVARARELGHGGHFREAGTKFSDPNLREVPLVNAPRKKEFVEPLPFFVLAVANPMLLWRAFVAKFVPRPLAAKLEQRRRNNNNNNNNNQQQEGVDSSSHDHGGEQLSSSTTTSTSAAPQLGEEAPQQVTVEMNQQIIFRAMINSIILGFLIILML